MGSVAPGGWWGPAEGGWGRVAHLLRGFRRCSPAGLLRGEGVPPQPLLRGVGMNRPVRLAVLHSLLFSLLPPLAAEGQAPGGSVQDPPRALRLYLDCQAVGCGDIDFLRTEIAFVDWVRDPRDAELHLLVTAQATGAGGRSYEIWFLGKGRFEGMADTLRHLSAFDATGDEVRNGLAAVIKLGLMRYVAQTPLADRIQIDFRQAPTSGPAGPVPRGPGTAQPADDPWNFWVFRAGMNGYGNGERTYRSWNLGGSFTASRTTPVWKVSLGLRTSYSDSRFDYGRVKTRNITRSHSFDGLLVRSLTDHWSAGVRSGLSSSTYANNRLTVGAAPVLEYNLFPYSESTRRMLAFQYALEVSRADYVEQTVYFKTAETLFQQSLSASLDLRQPWGSVNLFLEGGHIVQDLGKHHASLGGSVNLRLVRGLSLNVGGSVSRIHDRLSVPARTASVEDVLLRRKQLQTDYQFFTHFGLSYTFGSIYNNIVNPRISRGGGGRNEVMIVF